MEKKFRATFRLEAVFHNMTVEEMVDLVADKLGERKAAELNHFIGDLAEEIYDAGRGKICGNCIYWNQGGICLAHYENLVFGIKESPHAGKETGEGDTCRVWYEGEGLDLDDDPI